MPNMSLCARCEKRRQPTPAQRHLELLHEAALPAPAAIPAPFELARWSRPFRHVGGDLLAAWPAGRGALVVVLADVMGHDLPAALVASGIRLDLYRLQQAGVCQPAELLDQLNRAVCELFAPYFATAAACLLDARTNTLTWSLAGHPPALLRTPDGGVEQMRPTSCPLGLARGERFEQERGELPAGSTVVLYSDGVSDPLLSPARTGVDALADVVAQAGEPDQVVRRVRRAVRMLRRRDDRSVLAVRVREGE
jgi:serine phosphatase RsbU (regulator of sigma subunit)